MTVREAMSEVYVHQNEQVATKKAPYLHPTEFFSLTVTKYVFPHASPVTIASAA